MLDNCLTKTCFVVIIEYNIFWTILNGRNKMWWLFLLADWYAKQRHYFAFSGGLPVTKSFRKIRLESKQNTTFWVVPVENLLEQRKIRKGSSVLPDEMFQMEIPNACSFSSKQERIKLYILRLKTIFDTGKWK